MITPDTKDWTWILERQCPDCGFDSTQLAGSEVAPLLSANAGRWRALLDEGGVHARRPDDATWSPLEYASHVRDVYRRFDQRISVMLEQDDPVFENWDQDATAEAERYGEQDPATVLDELEAAASALVGRLEHGIEGEQWQRSGLRSDGARFSVDSLVRYMIHDPIHHVWDVTGERHGVGVAES